MALSVVPAWAQRAGTILVNGKIVTVDERFSARDAIAIQDGKIAALVYAARPFARWEQTR